MKFKLSALTLAVLPVLVNASENIEASDKGAYQANSVIVVYKENATKADRQQARDKVTAKISDLNSDELDDKYRHIANGRMANYKLDKMTVKDALATLRNEPAVLYAEPDYIVSASSIPNDARFEELWGMHNTGQSGGTDDFDIDAPEAWDISTGSHDVIVGVIDTGVDHSHPDLTGNMWTNPGEIAGDGIDNDGNGYIDDIHGINAITNSGDPMDDNGHGTHVAGTIGATGNDGIGVVGVNHNVSIVGCKFLSAAGTGSTSDALKCIDYMVALKNDHNIDISTLNNSWGGGGFSQALYDSITASSDADMLFVAAAGNGGYDNDASPSYPASYDHDSVFAVAGSNRTGGMYGSSQYGLTSVDIAAPAVDVLSSVPGGGYSSFTGTSMATPHVAGAAALVLSVNPELSAVELKELLMNSGDPHPATDGKTVSGKHLNVYNALLEADPAPGFRMSASPVNTVITAGDTATYSFDVISVADWDGTIDLTMTDSLGTASLSATSVTPGGSFSLTVPTAADTAWGDYEFSVTGTSGELTKTQNLGLYVNPQGLTDFTFDKDVNADIPDNDAGGLSSVITITDDITIFGSSTYVNITHTWIGDLIVNLTSPAGTTATLHSQSGGNADNIDQSFASGAFNGEAAAGDWTLTVSDNAAVDTGTLNNWAMTLTGLGEVGPAAPVADFSAEIANLMVTFSDASTDSNNDIASWAWDFGDGNSSAEQSPVHTFRESGTYDVTLTVTDEGGRTGTKSMTVVVSDVSIEAKLKRAYKSSLNNLRVDITWQGSDAETVDVYRNGVKLGTVDNNGIYRDRERRVDGNSFTYQICENADICSNEVVVEFE